MLARQRLVLFFLSLSLVDGWMSWGSELVWEQAAIPEGGGML